MLGEFPMSRIVLPAVLAALVAAVPASRASATVMVEVPLEELVQGADAIVHARVVSSRVRVEMRQNGLRPETVTTLEVIEWLAGPGGRTVELRELGGVWQAGGVHYEGTPEYAVGEEVVVFLERRAESPHDLRTLALAQGKFVVRHGVPGVPSSVLRDLDGIAFASWSEGRQQVTAPAPEPAMELGVFLEFVRQTRRAR
jgi:hypothetical protein